MITYKEYIKFQLDSLGWWQKLWMYMAFNPPSWRIYYFEYALRKILKSTNLDEAKKRATIALGSGS